jgi:hypothetical protein
MVLTWIIGFMLFGGFVPPPGAHLSAQEISAFYQDNTLAIRTGMVFCIISTTLIVPWGIGIAARVKEVEGNVPVLFYTQVAMAICSGLVSILSAIFWQIAAFRPFETSPEIVQAFNDAAWFLFLVSWPPFTVWYIALAMSIFRDKRPKPGYPRWVAFMSLWFALAVAPAGMMAFFKSGAFAWQGVLALYLPMATFLTWIASLSVYSIRETMKEDRLVVQQTA